MLKTKGMRSLLFTLVCLLVGTVMLTACSYSDSSAESSTPFAQEQPQSNSKIAEDAGLQTTGRFYQSYSSNPIRYMAARSINSEWGSATTIEGNTTQEILDNKIEYLKSVYEDENEQFIIIEGISEQEITDFAGIRYMYENSSLYQELVSITGTTPIVPESSYSLVADDNSAQLHRYIIALTAKADFELDVSYTISEGSLALMIVSQNGDILFEGDSTQHFEKSISLSLDDGLYSIVLVYDMEDQCFAGDISIEATIK